MVLSKGKINLGLSIPFKREDGYHEIQSIFVPISFGDFFEIQFQEVTDGGESSFELISKNCLAGYRHQLFEKVSERGDISKNILTKTFLALKPHLKSPTHLKFRMEKHLPPEGGIGGGSSNAGQLLKQTKPFTNLSSVEISELAKEIGADVPFFLQEKPQLVSGIGEILEPISIAQGQGILAIPPFGLSTAKMYADLQKSLQKTHDSKVWKTLTEDVLRSLEEGLWENLQDKLGNEFEPIAILSNPYLQELKLGLSRLGGKFVSMSGSGSCLYGLFSNQTELNPLLPKLKDQFPDTEFRTFSF